MVTLQMQAESRAEDLSTIVEALLFTGGQPLSPSRIGELVGESDESIVIQTVALLNQTYFRQDRPYEIKRLGSGYQMTLRPQHLPVLRRLHGRAREVRLSVAAIEVLSLVAYRQPIPLQAIDSYRGVESAPIVRQLRRRGLIEEVPATGTEPRVGAFRTTKRFLELFHLKNLDDLPRVQELEK